MEFGELSVMITGVIMMLKQPVVNWDTLRKVYGERERQGEGSEEGRGKKGERSIIISIFFVHVGAVGYQGGHFASGSGSIFLDNVVCYGTESSLLDCTHNAIGTNDCTHLEDAGVACLGI